MRYIMAQPSIPRFEWEVQVCIHNLIKIGVELDNIVILFSKHDDNVAENIKKLGVHVHVYDDNRNDYEYIPSLKPYLMYRYLEEDKNRENEIYFYMDSDVIFREKIDESLFVNDDRVFYGSDCGGYINYDYIMNCKNGYELLVDMANIVNVNIEEIKDINDNSIGGQYILKKPTSELFKKIYLDSNELWHYVKDKDTNLQKWTVEMWSTLWNFIYFDYKIKAHDELSFSWSTDDIDEWFENKIYHNAGVTTETDLFFKGKYVIMSPFDVEHDYINKNKNSYNYLKEIIETKNWLNSLK